MRVLRSALMLLISVPIFILVLSESREPTRALAQIAPAAPNAALVPPAAPGQPAAFATIGALPSLLPGPGTLRNVLATPVPTPRVFRCSCGSAGIPTSWVGTVPAANYFVADQQASTACVSYKTNAHARSPYIPQPVSPFAAPQTLYNGTAFNSGARVGTALADTAITTNPLGNAEYAIEQQCARCACN